MQRNIKTSKRPIPIWLSWDKYLKKVQDQWNGHFVLPCIHMNMYQPWISFKLSKKTDWLLLQNTRSGALHLRPHCVFHPIQSRGSSSRPVCKKTCFKTFYGGELKNFPMQTNKHHLIYLFFCMLFLLGFFI